MYQKIKLAGLTCSACKKLTEKRISSIADVLGVDVNMETQEANIESNREVPLVEIQQVLAGTSYQVIE